jgi:DNA-binding CsgD family transcriptional regulator
MARQLNLSPRTIEIHRRKILQKFDVGSTAEAINVKFQSTNL